MNDREEANSNFIALDVTPPGDETQYVPQSKIELFTLEHLHHSLYRRNK
jgi:hypothetical protein